MLQFYKQTLAASVSYILQDGLVVDVLAFWRGRLGSNPESVKFTQFAIDSPPMQPCTVCLGASCGDDLRHLAYT